MASEAKRRGNKKYDQSHPEIRAKCNKNYFNNHRDQWNQYRRNLYAFKKIIKELAAIEIF